WRKHMIKQRPSSCQANNKPHQEMILVGFKAKLRSAGLWIKASDPNRSETLVVAFRLRALWLLHG
ncbi:hypothetical protein, partial [Streptomyces sp. NPDC057557]|uniref:hypothetical protein n=1 Tax=Streptomyces sp. NPDC057557 TaxID=3346167 RepID=UPI0036B86CB8